MERLTIKETITKSCYGLFFGEVNRMSLFCREIMLYNEFVPALEPEKHNWEYRAYGHYDGIGIGKKIEFQNGSSFEKIYTSCAESDSENMSYATQTLLGFFENEEKEHEFWQTDKPFYTLSCYKL